MKDAPKGMENTAESGGEDNLGEGDQGAAAGGKEDSKKYQDAKKKQDKAGKSTLPTLKDNTISLKSSSAQRTL